MQKCNRREAMVILLGGMACLGGCSTQTGFKKPTLPENCYWVEFKYAWFCIDYDVQPGDLDPPRLPPQNEGAVGEKFSSVVPEVLL
jgi:hypothetical protein